METHTAEAVRQTISQLNSARDIALGDPTLYPHVVPGLLKVINANAILDLRRWGADFFAETFASPVVAAEHKQSLSLIVLDTLKGFLEKPSEDTAVIKSVIQTATSIYPFVFRYVVTNPDKVLWEKMVAIKQSILRRMDTAPAGVRICCIKFVQRVIQVQTPGLIADPRRPEQNEVSLALVPRDHTVLSPPTLEAESTALLDRILGILQENGSDALLVTATLNSLGALVKTRASVANKIVSTVLTFNPLRPAQSVTPLPPRIKVIVKSMARTTMAFLTNIVKKNPNHPLAGRIQQYVERMRHSLIEVFDESSRKRPAPSEPTDGLSEAKRQRVDATIPPPPGQVAPPPLPPGPVSFAQLFTLTQDQALRGFDVNAIPLPIVQSILVPLFSSIDKAKMDNAINAVRARYLSVMKPRAITALTAARTVTGAPPVPTDEDEEYDPTGDVENTEQVVNDMDQLPEDDGPVREADISLGPFTLPPPPPLSPEETAEYSKGAVTRVFGTLAALDQGPAVKAQKLGFNRLAASSHDRDAWITVVSRLATRAPAGLDEDSIKAEGDSRSLVKGNKFLLGNAIRDALYMYIIDDFRRRIDVAISWLNEEWYNDRVQSKQNPDAEYVPQHYERLMLKVLDGILPFLDAKDKILIRFLGEIPALTVEVLQRVTRLAKDPERVQLAVNSLHYLILFRPPVREICLDAVEDLYKNYDDTRPFVTRILPKWRPDALRQIEDAATSVE